MDVCARRSAIPSPSSIMVEGRPASRPQSTMAPVPAACRPDAFYAISNIGTDFPSQVNRKIAIGRGPRGVRTPSRGADWGVSMGVVTQRSARYPSLPPTPILKDRPRSSAPLNGPPERPESSAAYSGAVGHRASCQRDAKIGFLCYCPVSGGFRQRPNSMGGSESRPHPPLESRIA